jgi:hypothetical protein
MTPATLVSRLLHRFFILYYFHSLPSFPNTALNRSLSLNAHAMCFLCSDPEGAANIIRRHAVVPSQDKPISRRIFDSIDPGAAFVLIGEASHGTEVGKLVFCLFDAKASAYFIVLVFFIKDGKKQHSAYV